MIVRPPVEVARDIKVSDTPEKVVKADRSVILLAAMEAVRKVAPNADGEKVCRALNGLRHEVTR